MADITFLPTCSNCGKVLWGKTIDILEERVVVHREEGLCTAKDRNIEPWECPKCRHVFDRIVIPTKLPFDCPLEEVKI